MDKIITYAPDYEDIIAHWDKYKEWKQDPHGYFLIRIDRKNKNIEVGFCKEKNVISVKITGKIPQEIYHTIIRKKLVGRLEHATYLGKELHKAYVALQLGLEYIQDEELDFEKKV